MRGATIAASMALKAVAAVALWIVLFVVITPAELRDGRGFRWDTPWMIPYVVALAVLVWLVLFKLPIPGKLSRKSPNS
jgi:hypothetical protein